MYSRYVLASLAATARAVGAEVPCVGSEALARVGGTSARADVGTHGAQKLRDGVATTLRATTRGAPHRRLASSIARAGCATACVSNREWSVRASAGAREQLRARKLQLVWFSALFCRHQVLARSDSPASRGCHGAHHDPASCRVAQVQAGRKPSQLTAQLANKLRHTGPPQGLSRSARLPHL